jgi:hypothetical protein
MKLGEAGGLVMAQAISCWNYKGEDRELVPGQFSEICDGESSTDTFF